MKVLRSKCQTRVIFAKSDREVVTKRIDEISSVQLINGEIQFLDTSGSIVVSANWEAVEVPETFTALEKIIHLTEWLACDEVEAKCCDSTPYEYFAKTVGSDVASPAIDEGAYDEYAILPDYDFTFPDDLDCNSAYEVHAHFSFIDGSNTASDANVVIDFFTDQSSISEARCGVALDEPSQVHSLDASFMIEGDVSAKKLEVGVLSNGSAGRTLDDFRWSIIIKKVR